MKPSVLILHNIRSVHNVGSIFRTADAAGVSYIILSGYTPAPIDRFGKERKDFIKVSLGAEKNVPWTVVKEITPSLIRLRKEGYTLLALEQNTRAIPLFEYKTKKPFALVLGNEVRGIASQTLKRMDTILEIPMHGEKESLNVSVAAGIALFTLVHM